MTIGRDGASAPSNELFYDDLIASYTGSTDHVDRHWLEQAVLERLERPGCRYVLLVAEPGAGKTGIMAALAKAHPGWLRYFIRRDSTTPLSGGDAASMLLRLGHQLALRRPALFAPEQLEVVVRQRAQQVGPDATMVGVRVEDLKVSPFYRTAFRVEQEVGNLAGGMVGLEIAQATVEPRLLEPETLQYLALLDPAAALAATDPGARIVVLVDALDEVTRFRGYSILDWLERGPELPANVRVVLTSRPHPRLDVLRGARPGAVQDLDIVAASEEVQADARAFAARLFQDPALRSTGRVADPDRAAEQVGAAADGNFAYLTAYGRAIRAAVAEDNADALDALLRLDALPTGLTGLYGYFLGLVRRDIEQLGQLEIEDDGEERTPAWEGVGQRFLAVLAVARAPLTLDQLVAFGSVRAWRSEAANVLERFTPFLDQTASGFRLFHPSLAEFLVSEQAGPAVDAGEWHRRIVRRYRGRAATWADVDWAAVDDYGLLHLAEHIVELDADGRRQVVELVSPRLRSAALARFITDLPFRRIVETAMAEAARSDDLGDALCSAVFLNMVRTGLRGAGGSLAPGVFGLMARLGQVDEALARADLLAPGEHQFRCLEAIRACTPAGLRSRLGGADGADRLAAAAAEVPVMTQLLFAGLERENCIETATAALAPHDLERALRLAALVEEQGASKLHDATLAAAAERAAPEDVGGLLDRMRTGVAKAAVAAAERTAPGPLRDRLLDRGAATAGAEEPAERLRVLARIAAAWHDTHPDRAAKALAALTEAVEAPPAGEDRPWGWLRAQVDAAGHLREADPAAARRLLEQASAAEAEASSDWGLKEAARLWAAWGEPERSRQVVEALLAYYRGLGWYGPADDIAELAVIMDRFDPAWAQELANEAVTMVEPVLGTTDEFERSRVNSTVGGLVQAFLPWDLDRALRAARWMSGSWIQGGPWRSTDGRLSALASIGLEVADRDPKQATELLEECLHENDERTPPSLKDVRYVRGGLFRPAGEGPGEAPGTGRMANFAAYVMNCVEYWARGREWRWFDGPADVARSIGMGPGTRGAVTSWAGAVAAAVTPAAATDPETAIDLAGRVIEPCERAIACASLVTGLRGAGDARANQALAALSRALADLPSYEAELDLDKVPQGPVLAYLNPSNRARFEAALALPVEAGERAVALAGDSGSWYLHASCHAELLWRWLLAAGPDKVPLASVREALEAVPRHDDLQADLVRAAGASALAGFDPAQAEAAVAQIEHGWVAGLGRLLALVRGSEDDGELARRCRAILDGLGDDVTPLHRAGLAAAACHLVRPVDPSGASELARWGLAIVGDADPLSATYGLAFLAGVADLDQAVGLVRTSLARSGQIGNVYLRNAALARLLPPAVATGNAGLVAEATRRLVEADWQVLVEGLRLAIDQLVAAVGPAVVDRLHAAMRDALRVLNPGWADEDPVHVDGVLPPGDGASDWLAEPADEYAGLFLDQADLPSLQLVQDSRDHGPDPNDDAFARHGGLRSGFAAWMGALDAAVWRVVDIRFVFPDEDRAAAYHAERLQANSEGNPVVSGAPTVGQECAVFGGASRYEVGEARVELTMYFYLFRVANVVIKLFAAQGPEAPPDALTPAGVAAIAERIGRRIQAWAAAGPTRSQAAGRDDGVA